MLLVSFVIGMLMVISGCTTDLKRQNNGLLPEDVNIEELINSLNASSSEALIARRSLLRQGTRAIYHLVREVNFANNTSNIRHKNMRAARALRMLRIMETPAAVGVCRRLLLSDKQLTPTDSRNALLTEAVAYISENFSIKDARDTYISFLKEHKNKYMGKKYLREHWQTGWNADVFRVDVTYGVPFFVKHEDARLKDVLISLLTIVRTPTYRGSAVWRLSENGYSLVVDPLDASEGSKWAGTLINALKNSSID
ncbi:hypothetical protein H8D64_01815 [PVC group bacterium]|nr:hypothetical protein [PVC group bacterium]